MSVSEAPRSRGAEITLSGLRVVLGALLVLGLWLRFAGIAAWAFLLGLWISELGVPGEGAWSLVFPAVVALAVAVVPEARRWSLDARMYP